jgi:hypothetical protein
MKYIYIFCSFWRDPEDNHKPAETLHYVYPGIADFLHYVYPGIADFLHYVYPGMVSLPGCHFVKPIPSILILFFCEKKKHTKKSGKDCFPKRHKEENKAKRQTA